VPTPTQQPSNAIVGCGSGATGGQGGTTIDVDTYAELAAAVNGGGNRTIRVSGSGVWNGGGDQLRIDSPNTTIEGVSGNTVILRNVWLSVRTDNVILRGLRVRAGDEQVAPGDTDAININGASNVAIDHVEAIWGPDIGGIAILNNSDNVTVQHSIVGVGLFRSKHPESGDADGHSYALNVAGQTAGNNPDCVTIYRNLILLSDGRNPQFHGGLQNDLINNVIYGYHDSPQGNPRGLNVINNVYRQGTIAGRPADPDDYAWEANTSADHPNLYSESVWLSGNVADGHTMAPPAASAAVLRDSQAHTPSVFPTTTSSLVNQVTTNVGAFPRDARANGWINNVLNNNGSYWNGINGPDPRVVWP
jgi:hypothetical protein